MTDLSKCAAKMDKFDDPTWKPKSHEEMAEVAELVSDGPYARIIVAAFYWMQLAIYWKQKCLSHE